MSVALFTGTTTMAQATDPSGPVRLVNKNSNKCVQGNVEHGVLDMVACSSDPAQRFTQKANEFIWQGGDRCIEYDTEMALGSCDGDANVTEWLDDGDGLFQNAHVQKCLTDAGDKGLSVEDCDSRDARQVWDIRPF